MAGLAMTRVVERFVERDPVGRSDQGRLETLNLQLEHAHEGRAGREYRPPEVGAQVGILPGAPF
jgi:hypothetical protein